MFDGMKPTSPKKESADVPFQVFSFFPRSVKKAPKPNYTKDDDGVLVINDSDEEEVETNEPEYEFLCEFKFDANLTLPRPIGFKLECKQEPVDNGSQKECSEKTPSLNVEPTDKEAPQVAPPEKLNFDETNLDDYEEELLSMCKFEPICEIQETSTPIGSDNNFIIFICPQCGVNFDNHTAWRQHIVSDHRLDNQRKWNFQKRQNNEFLCKTCKMVLTRCTLKTLQQHYFSHLPYKVHKCKMCLHETQSLYMMISHIMVHKDSAELTTDKEDNETLWVHVSRTLIGYICPACGLTFDDEDAWQAHIHFSHNFLEKTAENRYGDHFKCSDCGIEIFSQHVVDLQQHLFTHLPFKSFFKCKVCNWTISRRGFMIAHIINMHKNCVRGEVATGINESLDQEGQKNGMVANNVVQSNNNAIQPLNNEHNEQSPTETAAEVVMFPTRFSTRFQTNNEKSTSKFRPGLKCPKCGKIYFYSRSYNKHSNICKEKKSQLAEGI